MRTRPEQVAERCAPVCGFRRDELVAGYIEEELTSAELRGALRDQ